MDFDKQPDPQPGPAEKAQLSPGEGVNSDVSSVAMDGRLAAAAAQHRPAFARNNFDGLSDAEIMLRVKAGDDSAFDFLVQKFRRPMVSFMYRMAHNPSVAEELAQEVFLRIYRSRQTYSADAKFTTWLYRIAGNLAVNYARDTKYERPENTVSLDEPDEDSGLTLDIADASMTVEQRLLRRERMAAIRRHVHELPDRQRQAVIMHKYQGMDYKQIGEVLHISESATKSLLFRAYETLREKLKEFI
jgi:RNA polymerase sigma-70 factor (ECF subfamily)